MFRRVTVPLMMSGELTVVTAAFQVPDFHTNVFVSMTNVPPPPTTVVSCCEQGAWIFMI